MCIRDSTHTEVHIALVSGRGDQHRRPEQDDGSRQQVRTGDHWGTKKKRREPCGSRLPSTDSSELRLVAGAGPTVGGRSRIAGGLMRIAHVFLTAHFTRVPYIAIAVGGFAGQALFAGGRRESEAGNCNYEESLFHCSCLWFGGAKIAMWSKRASAHAAQGAPSKRGRPGDTPTVEPFNT